MTDSIRYIGVDDLDIDIFESQYPVPEGMAYNSYLILDEKIAIMDTTDQRTCDEWLANLDEALEGRTPTYLVSHHQEPDHASAIAMAMDKYPELTLVLSAQAKKMMPQFFEGKDYTARTQVVKEGDQLALGSHTLQFIGAPMVHWPEVLMSYEISEKVLFAADGFGKFGALKYETDDWACEARRYYFNICGKYGAQVQNVLKKAASLDIAIIAPLHGPVLKGDFSEQLALYDTWSKYEPEAPEAIFVAYASIHGGTAKAAEKMVEILRAKGCTDVPIFDLCRKDVSESVEEAFRVGKICLMASSYDANVFPPMHDFLHHLQIKNFQKRTFAIVENGSWAPTAGKVMKAMVEEMKECPIVGETVTIRSRLHEEDIPKLEALADALMA